MDKDIEAMLAEGERGEAFDLLVSRYRLKVFRLAWSILRNTASAEEMAQEVFLRIWKALPGFRGQAALSTWIYAVTRNTCLTGRSRAAGRPACTLERPDVRAAVEAPRAGAPERAVAVDCAALLAGLPPAYRSVLALFYMEEKSCEEVSRMLDLPVGTVKTYLHRARRQLAARYAETAGVAG